ncbi:GNAT family N-acetyltransferase [Citreicella sp. C3M06]|uniref:GNAT family N-acetyltransferase n=1 Tax=Citreicella sp. C3M06 TaxID=2841564 RepID=UPI001C08E52B|nr:GNAT family N-acetyltransferase [Citreicella sp. C3M06]MBU2959596.1 GNAT family N-acetyltransferase [Citreicella sp. C3M06]
MIDPLSKHDLPQVAPLLRGLNALHVSRVPHRFHGASDDAALGGFLAQQLDDGAFGLVYRAEGVVRGYLLWRVRDIPASAVEQGRRVALLDHIAVAPSWRRRGIARRLARRFESEARAAGCDGWVVSVHSFNAASWALMRGLGARDAVQILEKLLVSDPGRTDQA